MKRILIALVLAVAACAAPLAAAVTYQGTLADGGAPATGLYDLRFSLYDAPSDGAALDVVTADDVTVSDGFFLVELSFELPIDGSAWWLGIEVRPGSSSGPYTLLTPRQALTATPYARFAETAVEAATSDAADTAGDADTLDLEHGAYYLGFANRTGVPADLADGDDDTFAGLACSTGEVPAFDGAAWGCAPDRVALRRTVVVGPVGTATENGAALLAAVASLPTPASQAEGWLIQLEPGRYDLGATPLQLDPWTTLAGSGETITVVTSSHCENPPADAATLVGAANTALRDLTVENTCAAALEWGLAIHFPADADDARLTRVTAYATGAARINQAVSILGDRAWVERVSAAAGNATDGNTGIYLAGAAGIALDCSALISRGTALWIEGQTWVRRGIFTATASTGIDRAVDIAANADLQDVIATGADTAVQVVTDTNVVVTLSRLTAQGRVYTQANSGTQVVGIEHSRIVAGGVATVQAHPDSLVGVAATQLWGDPVTGPVACAGVWDESWVFFNNTCP